MMQITVSVRRYNPQDKENPSYWQEYSLEMEETSSVLDSLIKIREEEDGSLALRCSCRSAICGSCAMRINGHAKLACNTKVSDVAKDGGTITVEPAGVMPVIKDLVVDQTLFWDKVREVSPWLQPEGEEPEAEYLAPNSDMTHLAGGDGVHHVRGVRFRLHGAGDGPELHRPGGAGEGLPFRGGPAG